MAILKGSKLYVSADVPYWAQKQIVDDHMGWGSHLMVKKFDEVTVRRRLGSGWYRVVNHRTNGLSTLRYGNSYMSDKRLLGEVEQPAPLDVDTDQEVGYSSAKKFFNPLEWEVLPINPPNVKRQKANTPDLFCQEATSEMVIDSVATKLPCLEDETTSSSPSDCSDVPLAKHKAVVVASNRIMENQRELLMKQQDEINRLSCKAPHAEELSIMLTENQRLKDLIARKDLETKVSWHRHKDLLERKDLEISGLNDRLIEIKEENYQLQAWYDDNIDKLALHYSSIEKLTRTGHIGEGYAVVPDGYVFLYDGPYRSQIVQKHSKEFNETIAWMQQFTEGVR